MCTVEVTSVLLHALVQASPSLCPLHSSCNAEINDKRPSDNLNCNLVQLSQSCIMKGTAVDKFIDFHKYKVQLRHKKCEVQPNSSKGDR